MKVDYNFIRNEGRLTQAQAKKQKVEQVLAPVLANQETQMRRLDEADRLAGFGGMSEFATQPELGFCFEQFAEQLLLKNSMASNLIDLQAEMNKLDVQGSGSDETES